MKSQECGGITDFENYCTAMESRLRDCWTRHSVVLSRAAVASSSSRIGEFLRKARVVSLLAMIAFQIFDMIDLSKLLDDLKSYFFPAEIGI
jgi:hypothetical protein